MKYLTYWYKFFTRCEELVRIIHGLKFARCEICGLTKHATFLFVQAQIQGRGSYDENDPLIIFTQLHLGQEQTKPNNNYYFFLQQLCVGRKVISMYTLIQKYPFSLYIPYGESGMGQKQKLGK